MNMQLVSHITFTAPVTKSKDDRLTVKVSTLGWPTGRWPRTMSLVIGVKRMTLRISGQMAEDGGVAYENLKHQVRIDVMSDSVCLPHLKG